MNTTQYAGRITNKGQVIVISTKGNEHFSTPYVSLLDGASLQPVKINLHNKDGFRYLTKHEVACFMRGEDINGNKLKTPAEERAEANAKMKEYLKTEKGKALLEMLQATEAGREVYNSYKEQGLF